LDGRRIDPLRGQRGECHLPKDVTSHCPDHVRFGARAGSCDGLIGSLAAQGKTEVAGDYRLTWSGQWRSVGREVGVDAADYGYASGRHTVSLVICGLAEGAGH
jgi:hypothetical protein